MKKLIGMVLMVSLASFSSTAMANNQAKLDVVKKTYNQAIKCYGRDCSVDPVYKNADASYKKALDHARFISESYPDEYGGLSTCTDDGYVSSILRSQGGVDLSGLLKQKDFKYSVLKNGNVRVKNPKIWDKHHIDIKLSCSGNSCKISDVIDPNNWSSHKQLMSRCEYF